MYFTGNLPLPLFKKEGNLVYADETLEKEFPLF
jgi:hypothetical protein